MTHTHTTDNIYLIFSRQINDVSRFGYKSIRHFQELEKPSCLRRCVRAVVNQVLCVVCVCVCVCVCDFSVCPAGKVISKFFKSRTELSY